MFCHTYIQWNCIIIPCTDYKFICPVVLFVLRWNLLTTDPRNRPVASDAGGEVIQLEDKGSGVGVDVGVSGSDVDTVDVLVHPLTDLRLPGYERWGVVVNIYQIDLQRSCAAGGRRAWEQKEERENSIMTGGKDDKRRCAQWKGRLRGTGVEGRRREANNETEYKKKKKEEKKGKRWKERCLFTMRMLEVGML